MRYSIALALASIAIASPAMTQGTPSFLAAGTYELTSVKNNAFGSTLKLASVTPQGVAGLVVGGPFSKCKSESPITSSSVGADQIILRSLREEDAKVAPGCNRTITLTKGSNGEITALMDNWDGKNVQNVRKKN